MPNKYQWIVFACTIVVLVIEINDFDFLYSYTQTYKIESFLLVAITAFVGFFLYRVAGKFKGKKSDD